MNGAYVIKWAWETARLVAFALVVYVGQVAAEGLDNVDDWNVYARALAAGAVPILFAVVSAQWPKLKARLLGNGGGP